MKLCIEKGNLLKGEYKWDDIIVWLSHWACLGTMRHDCIDPHSYRVGKGGAPDVKRI